MLFLKPSAQKEFFPFLDREFPTLARKYRQRFGRTAYLRGAYMELIRERVARIRARHGLASAPLEYTPELGPECEQLPLAL
jgi:hypothetical protein